MQYVKGFLNHGDSFSLQEAIHYGVPVVVLPLKLEEFNVSVYLIFLLIILNHIYPAECPTCNGTQLGCDASGQGI